MEKFNKLDGHFICENCGKKVEKLNYTARDHCPNCLFSKHVDILPGDRKNQCHGLLEPIDVEKHKNTYKIIYKCSRCRQTHKNIVANDDNFNELLKIMQNKT